MTTRVLMPLPDRDFDVTETAVPWRLLRDSGYEVIFATERGGRPPVADPLLISGVVFGKLGAEPEPQKFYAEMTKAPEFQKPLSWKSIDFADFEALLLPGGHAPGMRQYLGDEELQRRVAAFWALKRPVGAICHGVLVLARTREAKTGRSALRGTRTTCLPKYMERLAFLSTFWKLGRYYRTYPAYVEDEVRDALEDPSSQFVRGPITLNQRGTADDDDPAFVVEDGHYVSARWPGDAYQFARRFIAKLPPA